MSDDDSGSEDLDYKPSSKELREAAGEEKRLKRQRVERDGDTAVFMCVEKDLKRATLLLRRTGYLNAPKPKEWMRQLGVGHVRPAKAVRKERPLQTQQADHNISEQPQLGQGATKVDVPIAARALAAAKAAMSSAETQRAAQSSVLETRRFAGKNVQMRKVVSSEVAEQAAADDGGKPSAGLDGVLASLETAKRASVLDKSRDDWGAFKSGDARVAEELEAYQKSGAKYLDRVDFLKRAELREYEKERDQRLGSESRTRGNP